MKRTTINFEVTPAIKEKVQELAKRKHLKISDIARLAMYEYLEKEEM